MSTQLYEIFSPSVHFGGVTCCEHIKCTYLNNINSMGQGVPKKKNTDIHNTFFKNDNS